MVSRSFFLLLGCLLFSDLISAQALDKPVFTQESVPSAEEMKKMERAALSGSAELALELMWATFDDENQDVPLFWARIAMENGSAVGQHGYASLMSKKNDYASLARAAFHLRALIDKGDGDAAVLLEEVEKKMIRLGYH
jgi:hypothetical protein